MGRGTVPPPRPPSWRPWVMTVLSHVWDTKTKSTTVPRRRCNMQKIHSILKGSVYLLLLQGMCAHKQASGIYSNTCSHMYINALTHLQAHVFTRSYIYLLNTPSNIQTRHYIHSCAPTRHCSHKQDWIVKSLRNLHINTQNTILDYRAEFHKKIYRPSTIVLTNKLSTLTCSVERSETEFSRLTWDSKEEV